MPVQERLYFQCKSLNRETVEDEKDVRRSQSKGGAEIQNNNIDKKHCRHKSS